VTLKFEGSRLPDVELQFNLEANLAFSEELDQVISRGSFQPELFYMII